ncbi:MAG TPA: peptide deformylase [Tepidisphaeraceae bacterium]|jgi:peptide deformylase|nr:peptide deformylase [Tepidisphaeraceae bacterium]
MYDELKIISYPDPRLRRVSVPVKKFDEDLGALARRMFELMREAKGVGLAAAQVGKNIRLFISNHTQKPEDDRVYVNPVLFDADGEETAQEGCLSIPNINVEVVRPKSVRMQAKDLSGNPIEQSEIGYVARIWQHELDHLNGILLIDRMGPTAKVENRKILKELEEKYAADTPMKTAAKPANPTF